MVTIIDPHQRFAELESALRQRDERIAELRADRAEDDRLITTYREQLVEMRDHIESADAVIEAWIEAFDMVMTDSGGWTWAPWVDKCEAHVAAYNDLVDRWNKLVTRYNALVGVVSPRNVGRPLDASDEQRAQVLKRRDRGRSLRGIADDMNLSLSTVRTIVGQRDRTDRTSRKHAERIKLDKAPWKARARTRKGLPKRITEAIAAGQDLVRRAKALP